MLKIDGQVEGWGQQPEPELSVLLVSQGATAAENCDFAQWLSLHEATPSTARRRPEESMEVRLSIN